MRFLNLDTSKDDFTQIIECYDDECQEKVENLQKEHVQ